MLLKAEKLRNPVENIGLESARFHINISKVKTNGFL